MFIARLARLAVFAPNGDQVGRVYDVVALLRPASQPPRVLGLVVEVQPRRRIFLPMTRVTAIEAGGVITTGLVNLRHFRRRPGETLVLAELLDRKAWLVETGEQVIVRDVGMEQTRARDWEISKVYVQKRGRRFGWRGETMTVDWHAVTGLSRAEDQQDAAALVAAYEKRHAADLAHLMHELTPKRRAEVAAALDDDRLADVLEELPEEDQVEILAKLERERAADVLEAMQPDDAADLLGELPAEEAERLLRLMEPDEAKPVLQLLKYSEDTAGGLMTTEPVILAPDATVADALARVRRPELPPSLAAQVYVCRPPLETPTGKFLGLVHIQRLLREPPSTLVSAVLDAEPKPLVPEASLLAVTSYLATYNLVAAPVVDTAGHLLGAVTVDDVLDHLLPEDWRERAPDEMQLQPTSTEHR